MVTAVPTIVVFPEEKLTLDQKIEKWTWQYCRALEDNYSGYHRNMITNMLQDMMVSYHNMHKISWML